MLSMYCWFMVSLFFSLSDLKLLVLRGGFGPRGLNKGICTFRDDRPLAWFVSKDRFLGPLEWFVSWDRTARVACPKLKFRFDSTLLELELFALLAIEFMLEPSKLVLGSYVGGGEYWWSLLGLGTTQPQQKVEKKD